VPVPAFVDDRFFEALATAYIMSFKDIADIINECVGEDKSEAVSK
jgi:hypothetical protein